MNEISWECSNQGAAGPLGQTEEQMRGPEAGVKLTHLRRRQREGAGEGMELERLAGVGQGIQITYELGINSKEMGSHRRA